MNNEHLKDTEFDLIINVESSHCYGNFKVNDLKIPLILQKFVQGVDKLLKPGGIFAITDFRLASEFKEMEKDLESFNMVCIF